MTPKKSVNNGHPMNAKDELLEIHRMIMCPAEVTAETPAGGYTANAVKQLILWLVKGRLVTHESIINDNRVKPEEIGGITMIPELEALLNCTCTDKYSIEPHGKGHAIYWGRCNHKHGFNLATIAECTRKDFIKHLEKCLNTRHPDQVKDELVEALRDMVALAKSEGWDKESTGRQLLLAGAEVALKKSGAE